MDICRIVGSAVATVKEPGLAGFKLLLVVPYGDPKAQPYAAADAVGAGVGSTVLVSRGSAARQASQTRDLPVDAAVIAIVDSLDIEGKGGSR